VVIDASVAVGWAFPDEQSPVADAALDLLARRPGYVPPIFEYELASAVAAARSRGRLSEADTEQTLRQFSNLPVTCSFEGQSAEHLLDTAARHELSVYDAAYLVLAERHGADLATTDRRLRGAAEAAGVPLV
jgi:predicted nucleic acid-binding protein